MQSYNMRYFQKSFMDREGIMVAVAVLVFLVFMGIEKKRK